MTCLCRKCGHSVPPSNMVLHELRCAPPASPPTRLRFPSTQYASDSEPMHPPAHDAVRNGNIVRTSYGANMMPRTPSPASSTITLTDSDDSDDGDSDLHMYPPPDPEVVITGVRTAARMASPALSVGSPASPSSGPLWTCGVCTYDNQPGSADCDVCDTPRSAGQPQDRPEQHQQLRRSARSHRHRQAAVGSPLPSGWDCPRCVLGGVVQKLPHCCLDDLARAELMGLMKATAVLVSMFVLVEAAQRASISTMSIPCSVHGCVYMYL